MAFMGSLVVEILFQPCDLNKYRSVLTSMLELSGIPLHDEIVCLFVTANPSNKDLCHLVRTVTRLQQLNGPALNAGHIRRLFGTQYLASHAPRNPFHAAETYPATFKQALESGAEALFAYGHNQFSKLARTCALVRKWLKDQNFKKVAIIDSPIGNYIPNQVLRNLIQLDSIKILNIPLSTPRNDKTSHGYTYKKAIQTLPGLLPQDTDAIIYMDEAVTGSKLRKHMREFKKLINGSLSHVPFLCGAFSCQPHEGLSEQQKRIKTSLMKELRQFGAQTGFPCSWINLSSLPTIQLRPGFNVAYKSPIAWGESDWITGVRKINFVFNIIEQLKWISNDLMQSNSRFRGLLKELWNQDRDGNIYICSDNMMIDLFKQYGEGVNWQKIQVSARRKFPQDYQGELHVLSEPETVERFEWITEQVKDHVSQMQGEFAGNTFYRALNDLIAVLDPEEFTKPDDEYDYCHYVLPYNETIRSTNRNLIELVTQTAIES